MHSGFSSCEDVTQNYIITASFFDHIGSNFTGEGTALFKVHILSTDLNVGAFNSFNSSSQADKRRAKYNFSIFFIS